MSTTKNSNMQVLQLVCQQIANPTLQSISDKVADK